jgi:hypothetical protein
MVIPMQKDLDKDINKLVEKSFISSTHHSVKKYQDLKKKISKNEETLEKLKEKEEPNEKEEKKIEKLEEKIE